MTVPLVLGKGRLACQAACAEGHMSSERRQMPSLALRAAWPRGAKRADGTGSYGRPFS